MPGLPRRIQFAVRRFNVDNRPSSLESRWPAVPDPGSSLLTIGSRRLSSAAARLQQDALQFPGRLCNAIIKLIVFRLRVALAVLGVHPSEDCESEADSSEEQEFF